MVSLPVASLIIGKQTDEVNTSFLQLTEPSVFGIMDSAILKFNVYLLLIADHGTFAKSSRVNYGNYCFGSDGLVTVLGQKL